MLSAGGNRSILYITCCIAVVLFVLLWAGTSAYTDGYNRTGPTVPDYPSASNVAVSPITNKIAGVIDGTVTTFETPDSATTVLEYYHRQLTRPGWQHWTAMPAGNTGADYLRKTCPFHYLTIETSAAPVGNTVVTMEATKQLCR